MPFATSLERGWPFSTVILLAPRRELKKLLCDRSLHLAVIKIARRSTERRAAETALPRSTNDNRGKTLSMIISSVVQ